MSSLCETTQKSAVAASRRKSDTTHGGPNAVDETAQNSARTSQRTRFISYRAVIVVHCDNHIKHIDTLCGQSAKLMNFKASGIYSYQFAVRVKLGSTKVLHSQ